MQIKEDISQLIQSLSAFLSTRTSLLGLEWSQERSRLVAMIVLAATAFLFALLGLVMFSVGIVVSFWDTAYRLWAVWGLVALYGLVCLLCVLGIRRRAQQKAFPHTTATLKADMDYFQGGSPRSTSLNHRQE